MRPALVGKLVIFIPALVFAAYACFVQRFWFVTDDAFISFRYAQNLARGLGLRYNADESPPVEGYSNFLWTVLCAAFQAAQLDITLWPLVVSSLCGFTLLWLVLHVLHGRLALPPWIACLTALTLACFPPFAVWATSGLETMAFSLLVFVTFERLILRQDGPDALGGGIAALLMSLIRLEGIGWAIVILLLAVMSRRMSKQRSSRAWLVYLAIVGAGYGTYFAWRYWYFGLPMPMTAYAKANLDLPRLARGFNYVASNWLTFLTPFLILPGTLCALRRGRASVGIAVAAMAWGFPLYGMLVTGDFMGMGRFLAPGFAFNALLLGWLLADVRQHGGIIRSSTAATIGLTCIGVAALPAWDVHALPESIRARFHFRSGRAQYQSEYERWAGQGRNVQTWTDIGRALRAYADQRLPLHVRPSAEFGAIGAMGYYSGYHVFDRFGLITPEVGRRPIASDEPVKTPGHDKEVPRWYFLKDNLTVAEQMIVWEDDPQLLIAALGSFADQLRAKVSPPELSQRYVADFARVPQLDNTDGPAYVLTWTRIDETSTAAQSWLDFENRLKQLREIGSSRPGAPVR